MWGHPVRPHAETRGGGGAENQGLMGGGVASSPGALGPSSCPAGSRGPKAPELGACPAHLLCQRVGRASPLFPKVSEGKPGPYGGMPKLRQVKRI